MTGRPEPGGAPQQAPNAASSDPVPDRSPNAPGRILIRAPGGSAPDQARSSHTIVHR